MASNHPLLLRQVALQLAAFILVLSVGWPVFVIFGLAWNWFFIALGVGLIAFLAARQAHEPSWWQVIHLLFSPLLWLGLQFPIPPIWHLGIFLILLLVFRGALSGRIPLYLSGRGTAVWVSSLLPQKARLLDIGAGTGSLLIPLRNLRGDLVLEGIDNAPLPWLLGRLRAIPKNIHWRWGNFWRHSLLPYEAVYCFLSPVPMFALWQKACQEMPPGSLFISKAFPVPGILPESLAGLEGDPVDRLYVYRIPKR